VVSLVGASADLEELGITPELLHVIFPDIAIAAKNLEAKKGQMEKGERNKDTKK
jgi:hypothetical protein